MSVALDRAERAEETSMPTRQRRRFSFAEYRKMIEVGILTEQDHVELICGEILEKVFVAGSRLRPHHRFSFNNYQQMVESGILTEEDRVELIRGAIVEKMTIGQKHSACVNRLNRLLGRLVGDRAILGVQNPVQTIESCPEPDLALLRPQDDFYSEAVPQPADILLLIEVADSSLSCDRNEKRSLYAESGVREYWIVNLIDHCVEVHRDPQSDGTYADCRVVRDDETLTVLALPDVSLTVDQFLSVRQDR